MPSDDLDKVSASPARQLTLLADNPGRLVASSRVGTLLFAPSFQNILIETVERCTKDTIAELSKSSSTLTQDSINQAIREVHVRIGAADRIEYIPQKRMVEADYINFTVKREMQSWQQVADFHFAALKRAGAVQNGDLPKLCGAAALVPKGFVPAYPHNV